MDQRSVDGWFSGWFKIFVIKRYFKCQICKFSMRWLLQQWNRIIHNSHFKEKVWRNKRPRSRTVSFAADRLLSWSTITFGSLEAMILSKTTPTYSLSFYEMLIFKNSILTKLSRRESEKLKTVLELYDLETHQKKLEPDYHRLKTMVKRSIEQEIRNKNFEDRNGHYERNAVVKNQETEQRGQRSLGDCWQWKTDGQCSKGDNCSFRHDDNKRGEVTPSNPSPNSFMQQKERKASRTRSPGEEAPVIECIDVLARITSKELATTHFVKSGTLQNACFSRPRVVADLVKSAHTHIVRLMNSRLKGPKRMMTKVQWLY